MVFLVVSPDQHADKHGLFPELLRFLIACHVDVDMAPYYFRSGIRHGIVARITACARDANQRSKRDDGRIGGNDSLVRDRAFRRDSVHRFGGCFKPHAGMMDR